ncbi:MAG: hypothetical protein LBH71_04320, partial [Oscillospiraceae bacterium]|nr:hypothetical protein [Oscillospiraceae bacterium]
KEFGTEVIKAYNSTAEVDLDKEQVSKLLSEDAARESKELEMYEQEFQQSSRDFANLVDDLSCNIRKLTDNLMAASKSTSQKEDQKGEKVLCEDAKQQDKEEDLKTDIKDVADENEIIDEYKVRLQEDEVDMASDELVEMYTNDPDGNADPVSIDDSKYVMVKKVIKIKKDK